MTLASRKYLVTGAASGIGLSVTQALRAAGASVFGIDRQTGVEIQLDITSEDDWRQALPRTHDFDGLVHAAGVSAGSPLLDTSLEEWRRVLSVNLDGSFLALKHVLPLLKEGSSVVLLGSASGSKPASGAAAYCASKAALAMLAKVAALEAKPRRIRVNLVSPAGVVTPLWNSMPFFQELVKESGSELAAFAALGGAEPEKHPLDRMAFPQEIAAAILFLLSDDSAAITGQDLRIDAGYTL